MTRGAHAAPAWSRLAAALLAAAPLTAAHGADTLDGPRPPTWTVELRSERHADALPLGLLDGARPRDLRPRGAGASLAYADDVLRLQGAFAGGWDASLLARSSTRIVTDARSIAAAAWLDDPGRAVAPAASHVVLRFIDFAGAGVEVGRRAALGERWTARAALQVLALGRWRDQRLDGRVDPAAAASSGGLDGAHLDLTLSRVDSKLHYPFMTDGGDAHGIALLGAFEVAWRDGPWQAQAALHDVGALHWRGVPSQQARVATDVAQRDASGTEILLPLLQGRNARLTTTRRALPQAQLQLRRDVAPAAWVGAGAHWLGVGPLLPQLDAGVRATLADRSTNLALAWRPRERRTELRVAWSGLGVAFGVDRVGTALQRSRTWSVRWSNDGG